MVSCRVFVLPFLLGVAVTICSATTRHYYIAAEDVTWDYAPSKRDLIHAQPLPPPWAQTEYAKTRYIEYTDSTFTTRKPQPQWLGILGPIIRAEVGDEVIVEFLNRSRLPRDIHPHGLRYDKTNEGALYVPGGRGAVIPTNHRFTYHWYADESSGPGPGDPSSVVWWYHPHVDPTAEANAGLMGAIIVTAKGKARPDATPIDVDREFVATFMIFDELRPKETMIYHPEMMRTSDAGLFYAINGYIFGNLPGFVAKKGEKIRWYLLGMGSEMDIHSPHWHGENVRHGAHNTDVVELLPGTMTSADMVADNPGTWLFHCHVSDHLESGMMATYTIYEPGPASCPIAFKGAKLWDDPKEYSVTIQNTSGKPIRGLILSPAAFVRQLNLRPVVPAWRSMQAIAPGADLTITVKNPGYGSQDISGWALLPLDVFYADGSEWRPQRVGDCYHIYWRDDNHPLLETLPPIQMELNED